MFCPSMALSQQGVAKLVMVFASSRDRHAGPEPRLLIRVLSGTSLDTDPPPCGKPLCVYIPSPFSQNWEKGCKRL